jgi:hypothetical protein
MHSSLAQQEGVAIGEERDDQGMGIERLVHSYSRQSTRFRIKGIYASINLSIPYSQVPYPPFVTMPTVDEL